jgi:hypothetical protein
MSSLDRLSVVLALYQVECAIQRIKIPYYFSGEMEILEIISIKQEGDSANVLYEKEIWAARKAARTVRISE